MEVSVSVTAGAVVSITRPVSWPGARATLESSSGRGACEVLSNTKTPESSVSEATMSGLPSPFISAVVTAAGANPAKTTAAGPEQTIALAQQNRNVTKRSVTTISGLPSPFTSATATDCGRCPAPKATGAPTRHAVAEQHRNAIRLVRGNDVRNTVSIHICRRYPDRVSGEVGGLGGIGGRRPEPPLPLFSSTETPVPFVTIISGLPSPFRSAVVTESGTVPVV